MTTTTDGRVARRALRALPVAMVLAAVVAAVIAGCSSNGSTSAAPTSLAAIATAPTSPPATDPTKEPGSTTTTRDTRDYVMEPGDFKALSDMRKVRGFFIDNMLGHLDEAVAVAENPAGGQYPVGTVIQLIPQEAMVKRAPGYSVAYGDWEFIELNVSAEGTEIFNRGGPEVLNRFGRTSCANCHAKADGKFDFVCEKTNGCDPLPIPDSVFIGLQETDPRPKLSR